MQINRLLSGIMYNIDNIKSIGESRNFKTYSFFSFNTFRENLHAFLVFIFHHFIFDKPSMFTFDPLLLFTFIGKIRPVEIAIVIHPSLS